jgi:hypothetical protein
MYLISTSESRLDGAVLLHAHRRLGQGCEWRPQSQRERACVPFASKRRPTVDFPGAKYGLNSRLECYGPENPDGSQFRFMVLLWNCLNLSIYIMSGSRDGVQGLYRDNDGSSLYPQDGNTIAVLFDIADATQAARISAGLSGNWNEFGAVAPEASGTISPFVTSFEVKAHFKAGNSSAAIEIMRRMWGYALNTFSNSSVLEGYFQDGSLHVRDRFADP